MWILKSQKSNTLLKHSNTYTIGRQSNSHIHIPDSASISKSHAEITIYKSNCDSHSKVKLKDTSKAGSTVLRNGESIKLVKKELDLQDGDVITFGKNLSGYELYYHRIKVCHSSLSGKQSKLLSSICTELEMESSRELEGDSTHLITTGKALTCKVICAAASVIPIVTIDWLLAFQSITDSCFTIPLESEFLPPVIDTLDIQLPREAWSPNPQRKDLFKGMSFVIVFNAKAAQTIRIISLCGGRVFEYKKELKGLHSFIDTLDNPILVNQFDSKQEEIVKKLLKNSMSKMVDDDLIAKCVLSCNLECLCLNRSNTATALVQDSCHVDVSVSAQVLECTLVPTSPHPSTTLSHTLSHTTLNSMLISPKKTSTSLKLNEKNNVSDILDSILAPIPTSTLTKNPPKSTDSVHETVSTKTSNTSTKSLVDDILGSLISTSSTSKPTSKFNTSDNSNVHDILDSLMQDSKPILPSTSVTSVKNVSNVPKTVTKTTTNTKTADALDFLIGPTSQSQSRDMYTQNIQQDSLFAIPATQNVNSTLDILQSVMNHAPVYSQSQQSCTPIQDESYSLPNTTPVPIGELKGKTTSLYERLGIQKPTEEQVVIPCTPPPVMSDSLDPSFNRNGVPAEPSSSTPSSSTTKTNKDIHKTSDILSALLPNNLTKETPSKRKRIEMDDLKKVKKSKESNDFSSTKQVIKDAIDLEKLNDVEEDVVDKEMPVTRMEFLELKIRSLPTNALATGTTLVNRIVNFKTFVKCRLGVSCTLAQEIQRPRLSKEGYYIQGRQILENHTHPNRRHWYEEE